MYRKHGMELQRRQGKGGASCQVATRTAGWVAALCLLAATAGCEFITGPLEEVDTETQTPGSGGSGPPSFTEGTASSGGSDTLETSGSTGPSTGSTGTPLRSCCEVSAAQGCLEPAVEACVCNADPSCCWGSWNESCVAAVDGLGCGFCDAMRPPANPDPCCEIGEEGHVGCAEPDVAACVCAKDEFCCEEEWDELCADAVALTGCGECEPEFGPSCCFPQPGASCASDEVEACVCAYDEYCCTVQWDAACVESVEKQGCGPCDGWSGTGTDSSGSGTGTTGESSTGATTTGTTPTATGMPPTAGT